MIDFFNCMALANEKLHNVWIPKIPGNIEIRTSQELAWPTRFILNPDLALVESSFGGTHSINMHKTCAPTNVEQWEESRFYSGLLCVSQAAKIDGCPAWLIEKVMAVAELAKNHFSAQVNHNGTPHHVFYVGGSNYAEMVSMHKTHNGVLIQSMKSAPTLKQFLQRLYVGAEIIDFSRLGYSDNGEILPLTDNSYKIIKMTGKAEASGFLSFAQVLNEARNQMGDGLKKFELEITEGNPKYGNSLIKNFPKQLAVMPNVILKYIGVGEKVSRIKETAQLGNLALAH